MIYGFVENGQIKDGPRHLPSSWRNISGLDKMSAPSLISLGWLPWKTVEGPGEVVVSRSFSIGPTGITETVTRRPYTAEEQAAIQASAAQQIERQRQAAYADEADPIFFKSQRGEATREEWLAKIAEIKARFPK